jgi:CheY-like chemotaxis protein
MAARTALTTPFWPANLPESSFASQKIHPKWAIQTNFQTDSGSNLLDTLLRCPALLRNSCLQSLPALRLGRFPKGVPMHRILVVDDETLIADTLGLIFRRHGYEARVTYSADEALECARAFDPHLLLCDINMPKRSGFELMDDFSREQPECSVLVLTGHSSNAARVREMSAKPRRVTRVLTKPCHPDILLREAGQMLAAR